MKNLMKDLEFLNTWNTFIEYQLEDYGITMTEEEKLEQLRRINYLSGGDTKIAVEILEKTISDGETSIKMPLNTELT